MFPQYVTVRNVKHSVSYGSGKDRYTETFQVELLAMVFTQAELDKINASTSQINSALHDFLKNEWDIDACREDGVVRLWLLFLSQPMRYAGLCTRNLVLLQHSLRHEEVVRHPISDIVV